MLPFMLAVRSYQQLTMNHNNVLSAISGIFRQIYTRSGTTALSTAQKSAIAQRKMLDAELS
jgi:hypothetical protein